MLLVYRPLAWDLEWETLSWNDDYSGKAQGKVALFQIGDARNIILLQIARQSGGSFPVDITKRRSGTSNKFCRRSRMFAARH